MKNRNVMRQWIPATAVVAALGWCVSANAAFISGLIDVDFNKDGSSVGTASGAAVIGSSGDVWNGISVAASPGSASGTGITLKLVNGSSSGVTMTYSADYGVDAGSSTFMPALLKDYLRDQTNDGVISLSGLSSSTSYDVYLYSVSDQLPAVRTSSFKVTGASTLSGAIVQDNTLTTFVSGKNYLKFTITPDVSGNLTITVVKGSGVSQGNLNGFQITPVPEPASIFVLGMGGLILLARRRRGSAA